MKNSITLLGAFVLSCGLMAQSSSTTNYNQNVGFNQSNPQSRIHLSDDPQTTNCKPAILVESNVGTAAGLNSNLGMASGKRGASLSCGTPYVFRNNSFNGTSWQTTFNISPGGKTIMGSIFDIPEAAYSQLAVANDLGLYTRDLGNIRMGLLRQGSYQEAPGISWSSVNQTAFTFAYAKGANRYNTIFSLSPSNRVGVNTESPEAALHVRSNLEDPNEGQLGQIQGLLIENNGYRNHDYAFEIRTGQRPPGAAMQNGRIFSVSNAGTVHVGPNLNWGTPGETADAFKLYVEGGIRTERVKVDVASLNGWADYVFASDYQMLSTEELEAYIKEHGHLPGVPSAEEVVENGLDLGEMNKILLEKVEELTLRVLELEKQVR